MAVRVVIVDDHPAFRRSARRMLEQGGFEVVGEAVDGTSAIALTDRLEPELVLLDVSLPDMSGFDVAAALRTNVVLVSSRDPADFGLRARASGALGFIPKDRLSSAAVRELLEAA